MSLSRVRFLVFSPTQRYNYIFITAKERSGFGGGGFSSDDPKFAGDWRRSGPLPDLPGAGSRDSSRRRYESNERAPPPPSVADNASEWRSSRPRAPPSEPVRRSSFFAEGANTGAADREDNWSKGSKFRPSDSQEERKFGGGYRSRSDMGPPPDVPPGPSDVNDWRSSSRPISSRGSTSRGFFSL